MKRLGLSPFGAYIVVTMIIFLIFQAVLLHWGLLIYIAWAIGVFVAAVITKRANAKPTEPPPLQPWCPACGSRDVNFKWRQDVNKIRLSCVRCSAEWESEPVVKLCGELKT